MRRRWAIPTANPRTTPAITPSGASGHFRSRSNPATEGRTNSNPTAVIRKAHRMPADVESRGSGLSTGRIASRLGGCRTVRRTVAQPVFPGVVTSAVAACQLPIAAIREIFHKVGVAWRDRGQRSSLHAIMVLRFAKNVRSRTAKGERRLDGVRGGLVLLSKLESASRTTWTCSGGASDANTHCDISISSGVRRRTFFSGRGDGRLFAFL